MDVDKYNEILSTIRNFKGLTIRCFEVLKQKFPSVKHGTLSSILALEYQKLMKQNYSKTDDMISKYSDAYKAAIGNKEPPGIIIRIAEEVNIAPCLIAKLILHRYFEDCDIDEDENGANRLKVINEHLRDTSLIPNQQLAYEVYLCTIYDDQYSPIVETMKSSLGQQYEIQLYRQMAELGIAYRDEDFLRKYGYDKTPDVKLEVPIAIDGNVIHWIESKALFGEPEVHNDYVKNQYSSYWNRFGFGLVIYWFGYLETLTLLGDKRFLICDHLPDKITKLTYDDN